MSTATPTPAQLNEQYLKQLRDYDSTAVRYKWWYQCLWTLTTFLTWITLLLAIAGLRGLLGDSAFFVLHWVIPTAGVCVTGLTIAQTFMGLQGKWLKYRAVAERMRDACMRYRARLAPFHEDNADTEFDRYLKDTAEIIEHGRGQEVFNQNRLRYLLSLVWLPPGLEKEFTHTPDEGIFPRLTPDAAPDDALVLDGRLRNQRRWHLMKARTYFRRYVCFQVGLVMLSLCSTLYGYLHGRDFGVIALTMTMSMMFIAWRDFLDYGPLFLRYTKIAGNLGELERMYRDIEWPFDDPEHLERLRTLANNVEHSLSTEFQRWVAAQG
jgi:hypothetical protein